MKPIVRVLICAASLSACATVPVSPPDAAKYGPRPSADQAKAAAVAYVQAQGLKDPELRNIVVVMPTQRFAGFISYGWRITFEVNSKNSSGAYTGYVGRRVQLRPDGQIHCPAAEDELTGTLINPPPN
jgi:hypothetical protein